MDQPSILKKPRNVWKSITLEKWVLPCGINSLTQFFNHQVPAEVTAEAALAVVANVDQPHHAQQELSDSDVKANTSNKEQVRE